MDVYWWSSQNKKAVEIGKKALSNQINDPELAYKLAQAYKRTNNSKDATKTIDSLLKIHPENNDYVTLKKSLKK
jgi:predicted Zn-dependent protease